MGLRTLTKGLGFVPPSNLYVFSLLDVSNGACRHIFADVVEFGRHAILRG